MAKGVAPSLEQMRKYSVNRSGAIEAVRQSFYDFQTYAALGQTQLIFFQVPQGQGGKTLADTNMEVAGQLPSPKTFLIQSMEIYFFPAGDLGQFGAQAAAENINDVDDVRSGGYLKLFIGSKDYLVEAPLLRFPPKARLGGFAALADVTTAGADLQSRISYAAACGRPYYIDPYILLESTQNFSVSLNWPAAVAIAAAGRIGVVMDGILYRNSQ